MNYVKIIYGLIFTTLTIEGSVTQRHDADSTIKKNVIDTDEVEERIESAIWAEEAIIDEHHRNWKSCLASDRPRVECNAVYESMLRQEKPLTRLKHYYALLDEEPHHHKHCSKSGRSHEECISDKHDRKKRQASMEVELYPWREIYDMCSDSLTRDKCYELFDELQIARYRTLMPESLITIAKVHVCLDSGRLVQDCEAEADDHFNDFVAPKIEL